MFSRETSNKGYKMMKYVEEKMLQFFEGDDRNPYFEAVYIAFYHYYHQQQEGTVDLNPQTSRHYSKQIVYYLEKCLAIQLLSYGKFHSSVLQTLYGLGEAYHKLEDIPKCRHFFLEAQEVSARVTQKRDDMLDLSVQLKMAQTDDVKNITQVFASLDDLEKKMELLVKGPERRHLQM
jgi:hypothetical protein